VHGLPTTHVAPALLEPVALRFVELFVEVVLGCGEAVRVAGFGDLVLGLGVGFAYLTPRTATEGRAFTVSGAVTPGGGVPLACCGRPAGGSAHDVTRTHDVSMVTTTSSTRRTDLAPFSGSSPWQPAADLGSTGRPALASRPVVLAGRSADAATRGGTGLRRVAAG
jgi:hypothetical protein